MIAVFKNLICMTLDPQNMQIRERGIYLWGGTCVIISGCIVTGKATNEGVNDCLCSPPYPAHDLQTQDVAIFEGLQQAYEVIKKLRR